MSDEKTNTNEVRGSTTELQDASQSGVPSKKRPKNRKKTKIIAGVCAAVIVVAGIGMFIWHEQPSFCNAFCHSPMDPALATYEGTSGNPGVDKWGNTVEDAGWMLVVAHKEQAGATCMTCHKPVLNQQISEGLHWLPGDYLYPLDERSLTELNGYGQNPEPEMF